MKSVILNPKKNLRSSLSEIDEDKIVFYDIETDHQYSTYATLKTIGAQYGFNGRMDLVESDSEIREFKKKLSSPEIFKVAFNNINFDDVVLSRHGYYIHPVNRHDLFLIFKTIAPNLPAFSLKFIAFYYLADPHFPELEISNWCARNNKALHEAPYEMLKAYNLHDVAQTEQLFRVAWEIVIQDKYWWTYLEDLSMGEPMLEMQTEGGLYLDRANIWRNLQRLQKIIQQETKKANEITNGEVTNANSSKQLARYFTEFNNIELELTSSGEFSVKKSVLVSLRNTNPLADCAYRIREANGTIKYFDNYLTALEDTTWNQDRDLDWIPIQISISSARTRRCTSSSKYKLNFQNPNEVAKSVHLVPPGFLGAWFDATQIENVVHIYESQDQDRRNTYEANPDWNEYVWLCNQIIGGNHTKEELDDKDHSVFPAIPHWTKYKGYKTGKLAINFGMGIKKFCKLFGLKRDVGESLFSDIHSACPAIRELQGRVRYDLGRSGYVEDVFEKRYAGPTDKAYKIVAYLIQGCGTGSLPKAQIRSNWEALRRFDSKFRYGGKCGVMTGTCHDENSCRIDLRLGEENILQLLQKMYWNMTEKFTPLFDNIPLRAKIYLSKTTEAQKIECDIHDTNKILTIINGSICPICKGSAHNCSACNQIGYII